MGRSISLKERIEERSMPIPGSGCWIWMGASSDKFGYGSLEYPKGKKLKAHRVSYEEFISPIPAGMKVLHRCDIPPCVNPRHLFLGSQADNNRDREYKRRGFGSKKTLCKRGHMLTGDNVILRKRGIYGHRNCRICARKLERDRYWRNKATGANA